jgi:hypothetical protein
MNRTKTFDHSPPEHDKCPGCGSPVREHTDVGDEIYTCGSTYPSKQDNQSNVCMANSYSVRRKFSTIGGILDSCNHIERKSLLIKICDRYAPEEEQHEGNSN